MQSVKFLVEHEPAVIRHCYVICPNCNNKFHYADVLSKTDIMFDSDLYNTSMRCPICGKFYVFGNNTCIDLVEMSYPECAEGAKHKKEVITWE